MLHLGVKVHSFRASHVQEIVFDGSHVWA